MTTTALDLSPLHRTSPKWRRTNGDIAAGVGADLGLTPDPEQQWLLDAMYAETPAGLPVAPEVCVVGPRQNIKSATLEIASLTDLFVFGVPLTVWTAHEFKTARKSFEDMRRRILGHPDYADRADFRDSHGEEAIFLPDTGERIEFHARSGGSGRGFTCDRLVLDEWMYGQEGDLGALAPTMLTIPDAQTRYASSAGKLRSSALRELRTRGRAGDPSLAYVEYGAPRRECETEQCPHRVGTPGCALDDEDLWWRANCGLWAGRFTIEAIAKQRRMLPAREFMREFLSWWEDPPNAKGGDLDIDRWLTLADPDAKRGKSVMFGVDVSEDRTACISVGWKRPDGKPQLMLTAQRDGTVDAALSVLAVPARLRELHKKWGGRIVLGGPAAMLEKDLTGLPVTVISGAEFATACGKVEDLLTAKALCHGNQFELNESVETAMWRSVGTAGEKAWRLKDAVGVGPLAAATRALFGLLFLKADPPTAPVAVRTTKDAGDSDAASTASIEF